MLSSGGHPDPPVWSRVVWAVLEGVIAIALLLAGGLAALQAGAIMTALPFSVVMVLMSFALLKALRVERWRIDRHAEARRRDEWTDELTDDFAAVFGPHVDDRIDYRLNATKGWRELHGSHAPRSR